MPARRSRRSRTNGVSAWKIPLLRRILEGASFSGKTTTPWRPGSVHDFMHAKVTVADDVVFSYNRLANSPRKLKDYFNHVAKVEATDKHTVVFTFNGYFAEWDYRFGYGYYSGIYPKEVADAGAANWKNVNGTGPFKFVEWVKDDRVVLEANAAYWRGAPKIKKVVWRPIPDNFARVAALTRGEAQIITKVVPDQVAQVEKAGCCRVEHTLTNLVTVYLINAQKGPLANTKVRQALNYAVDKDKIIKELYKGYAIPIGKATTIASEIRIIIPGWRDLSSANNPLRNGHNPKIKPYPFDPARARQLLTEAGYPNGVDVDIQSGNGIHLNDRQLSEAVAVIMMSGVGTFDRVVETVKLGAETFLQKPFDFDVLERTITQAVAAGREHHRPPRRNGLDEVGGDVEAEAGHVEIAVLVDVEPQSREVPSAAAECPVDLSEQLAANEPGDVRPIE